MMLRPTMWWRLLRIYLSLVSALLRKDIVPAHSRLRWLARLNILAKYKKSRGAALRDELIKLGPIFVKFGQMCSTRPDIFPQDIINELSTLQDNVPSFPGRQAKAMIEKSLRGPTEKLFADFDVEPLASASIAQVHAATLHSGELVVVKVLRPKVKEKIRRDLRLLASIASGVESVWSPGRRLRLSGLVEEFKRVTMAELDLMQEAANASQLKRNFESSPLLHVPKIYWEFTDHDVMTQERIYGTPISDLKTLNAAGVDLKLLSERGVEIFFTQVFRDAFFHADMHPGNIFVDITNPGDPTYLGVDFGIMGILSPQDQHYLAQNLLAFFHRDYRQVAILHIESGWVPADTRVEQFESAIRSVCEPIFDRPLNEISFGKFLLNLFKVADQFHMCVQPQLFLLQKTLMSVEGLGRQLYPELDIWRTAQPFLERFVRKQSGVYAQLKTLVKHLPAHLQAANDMPLLLQAAHTWFKSPTNLVEIKSDIQQESLRRRLVLGVGFGVLIAAALMFALAAVPQWRDAVLVIFGAILILFGVYI